MEVLDAVDVSEDISVPAGTDLNFSFTLEPWDATGTSATFNVGASSYAMTISVTAEADDKLSTYAAHLTPGQLVTLGLNVPGANAGYAVRWTAGDGSVWALGHGRILVPS